MPCYSPLTAYQPVSGGALFFHEVKDSRPLQVDCGQCIGCRIRIQRDWTVRLLCENQMHAQSIFLTLTYDDEHLPLDNGLCYRDIQLFNKRVRAHGVPFRFFVCGEYGERTLRPHYHMCLFGWRPDDAAKCNSVFSEHDVYKSATVERLWGKGFAEFGEITPASAAYTASYALKKSKGDDKTGRYERVHLHTGEIRAVEREFAHMSLKPGIGYEWLQKFHPEVFNSGHDAIRVGNGFKPVPRYFKRIFLDIDAIGVDEFQARCFDFISRNAWDHTPSRLAVREVVAAARINFDKERKGLHHEI